MSLSALLNDDDEGRSAAPGTVTAPVPVQTRGEYLSELQESMARALGRDARELARQDWQYATFQEFELVSEWNLQSRGIGDGGVAQLYTGMRDVRDKWERYWLYKRRRDKLVHVAPRLIAQELAQGGAGGRKRRRRRAGGVSVSAPVSETVPLREQSPEHSPESSDTDEQEFVESDDSEKDGDFTIGYQKKKKRPAIKNVVVEGPEPAGEKKPKQPVTLDSEKPLIVRELARLCHKNKVAKAKKRRFTNLVVTDYTPGTEALTVKITLKQYHSKRLQRIVNEEKRLKLKEEEAKLTVPTGDSQPSSTNASPAKRRGEQDTTGTIANAELVSETAATPGPERRPTHDLPTYGLKMSAKDARAVQRHYDNLYITIWKDMARRDSNRMLRMLQQIHSVRSTNFKKTSSLCAREARKWQSRNFKQVKDFQTRARRGIREMANYWKKTEREERENKKRAEKIALEQAKRDEEHKESKRQTKKLNFLLTQTELYSHFIGRKIKTNEMEGGDAHAHSNDDDIDLETTAADRRNQLHEIDFDNEDDEQLKLRAAENASNVLAKTRAQARAFDEHKVATEDGGEEEEEELNFQNPTSLGDISLDQPKLLACTLKEYQLKGLNWLANLYDQGINGILADEMGLGKTVQSISVLAHLAEHHNIWGPFLVVTPASTLHNWINEISKFVPDFKILPYWGNANDRKVLRKFWDRRNLRYGRDAPFHVMVTSYQMVVSDVSYLQKMRWQYMILDEAQAIKSSQSSRWKNLLSFHCRNRLLLTGTPIQNNMQELWALLHFIMPSLFDSHDEFSEWFSKDIESHAEGNSKLNQQQLRRLHMILKPFMLRRIKKNVQSELGDKIEIDVLCDLTQRQTKLYKVLKSQVSSNYDAIENAAGGDETAGDQSIMNAVMQFRKVCNHPDLFERADVESPFSFVTFGKTNSLARGASTFTNIGGVNTMNNSSSTSVNNLGAVNGGSNVTVPNYVTLSDVVYSARNPITFHLPRLVYDEIVAPNYRSNNELLSKIIGHTFDIYHPSNNRELAGELARLTGLATGDISKLHHASIIDRIIDTEPEESLKQTNFDKSLLILDKPSQLYNLSKQTTDNVLSSLLDIRQHAYHADYLNTIHRSYHDAAAATPIHLDVQGSSNATDRKMRELFDPKVSQAFSEIPPIIQYNMHVKKHIPLDVFPKSEMFPAPLNKTFSSTISMPSMDRFITDSAKLKKLDEMLPILKAQGHRVLIYFQMTKMMDLMEEYLTYRQYKHIRLDGSSKLEDRRDLVHDWQTKQEIFVFLLSTRAGGLGINLTAADTVVFYDSDWNPTIDSQAMDRAHRLGQTRQVTVYRLLVRGTIEERMRDRAKQKEQVQQVVMEGKAQDHHVKTIEATAKIGETAT
ncbi:chromatin-remodeling ATPase INO80 KNAG_0I00650 [Huiozyma naganishii CBS 8797]|uniref:Chromatin-remodeling ATPase INO80 n=1 Tax=Huiozyma naganishii (strain ATCC MYA-139 / BCRC 22969 / CBS 8797 / KCTC 17520 / NBRC 10181 / NCYC 3082 / Yp74L-3) TaxID=1071383 RepID=J7SA18_HUIN7|nr:hypothetical protein KNAG_0I00650 [Kazachstania naganishii CBS 8797]CCK71856.1 hypothetical protein KNAG_0I00650 [Kazachstania naganishii CBS 8797]